MRNNKFLNFLVVIFVLLVFSIQVIAAGYNNILNKISIEKLSENSYTLSMFFKQNYTDKAFIQKAENGLYFVYLPNTEKAKNVKVKYKNRKDKSKINLVIEDKE